MKVGTDFYSVYVCDEDITATIDTYRVSCIRNDTVHLIEVTPYTWGKRSSKTGDYGWLSHISEWDRHSWKIQEGRPARFSCTKKAAWRRALTEVTRLLTRDRLTEEQAKKLRGRIKTQITKLSK